jgi:hypothetical protein
MRTGSPDWAKARSPVTVAAASASPPASVSRLVVSTMCVLPFVFRLPGTSGGILAQSA